MPDDYSEQFYLKTFWCMLAHVGSNWGVDFVGEVIVILCLH